MNKLRTILATLMIPVLLWATACNQSQLASLTNILGTSASNIASLENNPTLAAKLKTDTAAAVSAINAWKSGTPAQEAIQALNLVEDDLNLIPGTSQYAPLVDLAIGTVESILALLPQPAVAANARVARRAVTLNGPAPKTAKEYKAQFNSIALSHGLSQAVIK